MAKDSKKDPKEDAIDITKIYEIIRDKGFIQELWLDVLSDLRQKPSYVKLKRMVEKVIKTSVKNYATKPKDHEEKLKTRTTFTDMGIMSYTIDTLISDVLKKKLKDELNSVISRVIDEHNHVKNLANIDKKTNSVIMLEDIGKLLCSNGQDDEHKEPHAASGSPGSSKRRLSEVTATDQPSPKKGNRLHSIEKETSLLKNGSLNITCSNIITSTPRSPSKRLKRNSKKSGDISANENSDVDVTKVSDDDEEDNHSIRSVSSVHTSDLSSFEDDISISSEDENGFKIKKHVSLKLAKDLYSSGRLSDLHKTHQRMEEKVSPGPSAKHSVDSPNQRSSTRMRKPNSKYASDDVVCLMKLVLSQTDSYISDEEAKEEVLSTDGSEMQQSSSPIIAMKKQEKSSKNVKSSMYKRNPVQESISSDESDYSLPSLENLFKKEKQTAVKRGRPKKDTFVTKQTSPAIEQMRETKVKRGRPKSSEELVANRKQCVLDEMLPNLEKKLQLKTFATQKVSQTVSQLKDINSDHEIKRKKGRPSNNNSVKQIADEPIEHSVESFSKLEESLCLKDKCGEVNAKSSPSKSTKSYDTSDLYKPRSDFRIFNSRGSRAFTLFSN